MDWAWKDIWLKKKTKIKKCFYKLLSNHVDVVILCCSWDFKPTLHREKKQNFLLKLHHVITVSSEPTEILPAFCFCSHSHSRCLLPGRSYTKEHHFKQMCHGAPSGSVGRVGALYTAAMSSLQWLLVRFHLWHLCCMSFPLSLPYLLSYLRNKCTKAPKTSLKKTKNRCVTATFPQINLVLFLNSYQKHNIQPYSCFWSCKLTLLVQMSNISWQTA